MIRFVGNMIVFYISALLFAGYSILIIYYWLAWRSVPELIFSEIRTGLGISVVIAARNEEENIIACLESVCRQDYPAELLQIVVVDDCSNDKTWELVSDFQYPGREIVKVRLEADEHASFSAYKKRAVLSGINKARHEVIVTTDADCVHGRQWLTAIAMFYGEKNPALVAAPVIFEHNASLLQVFQALDFLVLQGITAASVHRRLHSMCNGANLSYQKKAFWQVNGFEGISQTASGDDMLLMHKISKEFPGRVYYLKSKLAIVSTQPMKTWIGFLNQRIRWASKARVYQDRGIFWALMLVYFLNLSFLSLFLTGFWIHGLWIYLAALVVAKTMIELPFVYSVARYFDQQSLLKYFFFFQPLHIGYTILAGWLGQFGKFEWKGRKVR